MGTTTLRGVTCKREVPWYIWCAVLAVTSAMIGGNWDISWHESIGRDTFWTPAHMAIYLCGVLAGIAFGYIILSTTFSRSSPLAEASVHIWGFRAPLGAFIASWGGIAMLTSAPFDNWWHGAYGLDVKIVSPPHILLFTGVYGVLLGTLVLIAGHLNRSTVSRTTRLRWLFIYVAGIMLVLAMVILMEYTTRPILHRALPYILVSAITPIPMAVAARGTGIKFAATAVAGFYILFNIGLILVLPLFPAQPKLGPVYQHVTQFIPPQFPLLLVIPAFALDLIWQRSDGSKPWRTALISAVAFVSLSILAEWPFASFLMTPAARNAVFGTGYLYYALPPTSFLARNQFYPTEPAVNFLLGVAVAVAISTVTIRWGLSRGDWVRQVKR